MPGRFDSSTSRIFCSTVNRRRRCRLVITWIFSFLIVINLGVCLGPQAIPRVRLKRGLLQKLSNVGSKRLIAYLKYVESLGENLGRNGGDGSMPVNDFELEIQRALEARLGTGIVPQYGVGKFLIDLAIQHPDEPGRMVLAVECDGASYHSTPTARMRDRIRQHVLEGIGWMFCRIWSTDWFNDRESEIGRVELAYRAALARHKTSRGPSIASSASEPNLTEVLSTPGASRRGPSPIRTKPRAMNDVEDTTLRELLVWIKSDGKLYTNDDLVNEMVLALGFVRRTAGMLARIGAVIDAS